MREVDERLLTRIWRGQWLDRARLETVDGRSVQVVFPGRVNGLDGPDVRDAIVTIEERELLKGDLELHVQGGDWRAHGHHLDPAYNGVVLHVTWTSDRPWVEREDGTRVATLALKGALLLPVDALLSVDEPAFLESCKEVVDGLGPQAVGGVLESMGEERFRAKGVAFQGELAHRPGEEVLYQGLMESMGYGGNQEPFGRLARLLPLSTLQATAGRLPDHDQAPAMAAYLLGTSGLLPSQSGVLLPNPVRSSGAALEEMWRDSGLTREMKLPDWRTTRIRPANQPANRIVGAARLMSRFAQLAEGLRDLLLKSHFQGSQSLLEDGLIVPGYLGRGRVREMLASVVLPFLWGLGEERQLPVLAQAAVELFRGMPKGQGNRVTREMEAQLLGAASRGVVNSLARQQGLIHLFKGPCRYGSCEGCPLGQALAERKGSVEGAPIAEEVDG